MSISYPKHSENQYSPSALERDASAVRRIVKKAGVLLETNNLQSLHALLATVQEATPAVSEQNKEVLQDWGVATKIVLGNAAILVIQKGDYKNNDLISFANTMSVGNIKTYNRTDTLTNGETDTYIDVDYDKTNVNINAIIKAIQDTNNAYLPYSLLSATNADPKYWFEDFKTQAMKLIADLN